MTLLARGWPSEDGPERAKCAPVRLRRGIWRIEMRVRRRALDPDGPGGPLRPTLRRGA